MTVEEIFTHLSAHMIEGMMTHEQLANLYHFLALDGYKCCHDYHFLSETISYRKLQKYYMNKYNKLIPEAKIDNKSVVPEGWYKHTRFDVDSSTKRAGVKNAITAWKEWETKTHKLYCEMVQELETLGEYTSADMVRCLLKDVDCEIQKANEQLLKLADIDYSLSFIVSQQEMLRNKYKEKKKKLFE